MYYEEVTGEKCKRTERTKVRTKNKLRISIAWLEKALKILLLTQKNTIRIRYVGKKEKFEEGGSIEHL